MKVSLKTAWLNNQIPKVQRGIFGDKLTKENIKVKTVLKECAVLVGEKQSGVLNDRDVVNYFLQFVGYPEYRHYILDTLHKLDKVGVIK